MKRMRSAVCAIAMLSAACGENESKSQTQTLTIAAATNLTSVFGEIARAFESENNLRAVLSFGSTAQLTQQIEQGAPFDVFAAADTIHVDRLLSKQLILPESRAVYAVGRLALWIPDKAKGSSLADLPAAGIRAVAIATPELAPYGEASVEALRKSGLWQQVQPKIVYANSISMAKQFASTGNADAAFTAYSLVLNEAGAVVPIDDALHAPLEQAAGVLTSSRHRANAEAFLRFLTGQRGRDILKRYGYGTR